MEGDNEAGQQTNPTPPTPQQQNEEGEPKSAGVIENPSTPPKNAESAADQQNNDAAETAKETDQSEVEPTTDAPQIEETAPQENEDIKKDGVSDIAESQEQSKTPVQQTEENSLVNEQPIAEEESKKISEPEQDGQAENVQSNDETAIVETEDGLQVSQNELLEVKESEPQVQLTTTPNQGEQNIEIENDQMVGDAPNSNLDQKPSLQSGCPTPSAQPQNSESADINADNEDGIPSPPKENFEKSAVTTATANEEPSKPLANNQPLNLNWSFGINRKVPCINLTDESRHLVMYAAAHVIILYDYQQNTQTILQGHGNNISCMTCSEDKRWLVTGDCGPGSCVIVWDSYSGIPVQTIFDVHRDAGVVAMAMTEDGKYISMISGGFPQVVSVWDWTTSSEPVCSVELDPAHNHQTYIKFHPQDSSQFVTNSETQVLFYNWNESEILVDAPFLSDGVFNRTVGNFSQSIFQVSPSSRAFTATSYGNLVVWDPIRRNGSKKIYKRRALKLVRVKDKSLSALTQTNNFIVAGDTSGHVRFFDDQLNLVNWYQDLNVSAVTGISFTYQPQFTQEMVSKNEYPDDATIAGKTFVVRDFVVSTKSAEIVYVKTNGSQANYILKEHDASVYALAASPTKSWLAIASYSGLLKIWDYISKEVLVTRIFEGKTKIQSIAFSHDGLQIAVGTVSGQVYIVDAVSLSNEVMFHYTKNSITQCVFSDDSKYLATSDEGYTTSVFEFSPEETIWKYLGRHKAHYEPIQDILFGFDPDNNSTKLLTLGKDRVLVEYDLPNSSKDDLRIKTIDRIEQSAVPLCLSWYPDITKESFIITANDQYKLKLYNTTTKMCRKTILGPTYGSPARIMAIVPPIPDSDISKNRLLSYATDDKVGLQLLPLDGNPHRSISVMAHPSGVTRLVCSYDGKYVFTSGGKDSITHMWSINSNALEAVSQLGGEGLLPFYGLLEGGRDGDMYAEMENYFYYAQLRSQGINTTDEREVFTVVPLDQVPFLVRALGFYPSEQEVEDMLNEVKFSKYVETGEYVVEIDLADFIKLYVNHRPAFGLSADELQQAFALLSNYSNDNSIERSELLSALQRKGEHMTESELSECLTTLLGFNPVGGSAEHAELDVEAAGKEMEEALPDFISPNLFATEILGLPLYGADAV